MALPDSATAVNTLLATPWEVVAKQRARDAERDIETSLESRKLVKADGKKSGVKWNFGLTLKNVKASVDLDSPPALTKASSNAFTFAAPGGAGWNFSISGDVKGNAWVKVGGTKIFTWSPGLHFGLRIRKFKVVTSVTLDTSRPNRPKITTSEIQPSLQISGGGFLPVSIPISFTFSPEPDKLVMRGRMTGVDLKEKLSGLGAKLTADIVVSVLRRGEIDVMVPEPEPVDVDVDAIPLGRNFQTLKIEFNGRLRISLKKIGKLSVPFQGFDLSIPFPASEGLGEVFTLLSNDIPQRWGDERRAPYGDVPDPETLAAPVAEIEAAAETHMPHGAALSFDYGTRVAGSPRTMRDRLDGYSYSGEEDSAIWTGHYLAAESLRYAASQDPGALARVKAALEGLRRLFWVTTDAVRTTVDGQTVTVPVAESDGRRALGWRAGILARTAKPDSDSHSFVTTSDKEKSGPLEQRPCHYIKPEGGWRVPARRGRTETRYDTFASIPSDLRLQAEAVGPVWYGWGCGNNHPVSKDQYVGTMMGLAMAWKLVPEIEVRSLAGKLIEDALDYLIENRWTVRLPPDWRIQTDFLGDIPKQLAFLRIGKTVAPQKYGGAYDDVAVAAGLAWLSPWLSSFDPVHQYYKFNLSHAAFVTGLALEEQTAQHQRWYDSYLRVWGPVAHHRNAYFDLVRILAEPRARRPDLLRAPSQSNPDVTIEEEVKLVLGEWVRRWTLIKGPSGGALHKVADAAHQLRLWPDDIGRFKLLDGRTFCLAKYALPVDGRYGRDKDFMWQRDPFRISVSAAGCKRSPQPDTEQILKLGSKRSQRESPGIDYLLAYWLAVYIGILPGSTGPPPP
jgi:hypothetical protein